MSVASMPPAAAWAPNGRELMAELYACLRELDPARVRSERLEKHSATLASIRARVEALVDRVPSESSARARFAELVEVLDDVPTSTDVQEGWGEFRTRLRASYEELAASLQDHQVHVPNLRPTNYTRNAFHVACGISVLLLIELVLDRTGMIVVAGSAFVGAWTMEISRRYSATANRFLMWVFGKVAHPHERHRINSSTWYTTALTVLALIGSKPVAALAVIVLGIADPVAALIGRRFGKTKLVNGRSLEGSLAFAASGALAAFAVLRIFHADLTMMSAIVIAVATSVAAAIAELLSKRVDDNLAIPLASAASTLFVAMLLGLSL